MKTRCFYVNATGYADYGGRGITVCERWKDNYSAFLEDMGPRPEGKSLDRINNDGNYEPGNCKWSTPREQQLNKRVRLLECGGIALSYKEWAKRAGITVRALRIRIKVGWPVEQAVTRPPQIGKSYVK